MAEGLTEPLSWKGYSARRFMSLDLGVPELAKRAHQYSKVPMLHDSLRLFDKTDASVLEAMQKVLLDRSGHSAGIILYFGMMEAAQSAWLRQQVSICIEGLLYFARTFLLEGTKGPTLEKCGHALEPSRAQRLRSVLATSKYNYPLADPAGSDWYALAKLYPLFVDTGVDLMCREDEFIFSEAQIRYNAPRPFLLQAIKKAYKEICGEYFERNAVAEDDFEQLRLSMLEEAYGRFAAKNQVVPKLLIDAWTYENFGANHKELARALEADYILFDDVFRNDNPFQSRYSSFEKLFLLNQPALNLLCPDSKFFTSINDEKLEEYDDLAWNELYEDHMKGRIFLSNPPCTDILNDKALYEFLPDFCRIFLGKESELPVISSKELWDYDNPTEVNTVNLDWAINCRAEAVIAHRYLEGGMGIRVGMWCDDSEWKSFIDNFVRPRPYLFVVRPYYAMSPDCSLRLLASALVDPLESEWKPEINVGTDMFGRISLERHVTSESARCYLVMTRE